VQRSISIDEHRRVPEVSKSARNGAKREKEERRNPEISPGRHERGRLPGGRENVHAGRPPKAALREAAEGAGASAGLRDATGCRALLGRGASHHAARRILAARLQKGLSR